MDFSKVFLFLPVSPSGAHDDIFRENDCHPLSYSQLSSVTEEVEAFFLTRTARCSCFGTLIYDTTRNQNRKLGAPDLRKTHQEASAGGHHYLIDRHDPIGIRLECFELPTFNVTQAHQCPKLE